MKTICVYNGKIVMSQSGEALETMQANAVGLTGATVEIVADDYELISLEDAKLAKKSQIERDRDEAIAQPVFVHGRYWQARSADVDNLSQELLTVQAGVPMSPVWRDASNNNMTLTNISQLVEIASAMKAQKLLAYQNSWIRKASVDAATTIEEVNAI